MKTDILHNFNKSSKFIQINLNSDVFIYIFRNSDSQQYENSVGPATTEYEEEAKYLAKRKMLGNIKFIGELGKLQIVHDSILHRLVISGNKEY